jgi:hypothetical protein
VFDSITNNPHYGDERHFFDAKPGSIEGPGHYCSQLQVLDGEVLVLRVYVENSAYDEPGEAATGTRVARGSTVYIYEDPAPSSLRRVTAVLSASNAQPGSVWSSIFLSASHPFRLDLLGDVTLYSGFHTSVTAGLHLASSAWEGGGALFGPTLPDGNDPPGYKYSAVITANVRVTYLAA